MNQVVRFIKNWQRRFQQYQFKEIGEPLVPFGIPWDNGDVSNNTNLRKLVNQALFIGELRDISFQQYQFKEIGEPLY